MPLHDRGDNRGVGPERAATDRRARAREGSRSKRNGATSRFRRSSRRLTRYKSLADIERGFKVRKSKLEIGAVYHRLPERIRTHALICFTAFG